jgi:hypothetical protein
MLELRFEAEIIHWRGPAPYFFARIPAATAARIESARKAVSYGWGVIPVQAVIGEVAFETSLFPKDGTYLLPLKDVVRRRLRITADDRVEVAMTIGGARRERRR